MDILEESRDGIVVVAPRGRIDCNTSAHLERKLLALLAVSYTHLDVYKRQSAASSRTFMP